MQSARAELMNGNSSEFKHCPHRITKRVCVCVCLATIQLCETWIIKVKDLYHSPQGRRRKAIKHTHTHSFVKESIQLTLYAHLWQLCGLWVFGLYIFGHLYTTISKGAFICPSTERQHKVLYMCIVRMLLHILVWRIYRTSKHLQVIPQRFA